MTESREPRTRADGDDTPDDLPLEDVIAVQGDATPDEQDAVITPDEMERVRATTLTELDRGEVGPDLTALDDTDVLDGLDLSDLRDGETDDPDVAAEEGLTYVPPTAPPLTFDDEDDEFATESDLTAQIRDALRADAATTELADRLLIATRGSTAVIRGVVDDISDSDAIVEVVEGIDGIETVVDQTELASG